MSRKPTTARDLLGMEMAPNIAKSMDELATEELILPPRHKWRSITFDAGGNPTVIVRVRIHGQPTAVNYFYLRHGDRIEIPTDTAVYATAMAANYNGALGPAQDTVGEVFATRFWLHREPCTKFQPQPMHCQAHTFVESGALNLLDGVAASASAANRTVSLVFNRLWSKVVFSVDFTRATATTLTTSIARKFHPNGIETTPQSGSVASGTRTLSDLTDSKDVSGGSKAFDIEHDVRCVHSMDIVFATNDGGADTFDVQATAISGY